MDLLQEKPDDPKDEFMNVQVWELSKAPPPADIKVND